MPNLTEVYNLYHLDYYFRTIVVCFFSLILFRINKSRLFSQLAAYDLLIFIILGALLGNAILEKELFIPSLICCVVITGVHRLFGILAAHPRFPSKIFKGRRVILYENNEWSEDHLHLCSLNKEDIYQELRSSWGINSVKNIRKIIMERNGKISFLENTE